MSMYFFLFFVYLGSVWEWWISGIFLEEFQCHFVGNFYFVNRHSETLPLRVFSIV
jgi:hypothetical protein